MKLSLPANDLRLAGARHLAVFDLIQVGFALREPVGRPAHHVGQDEKAGDAGGFFRIEAGGDEERGGEALELFARHMDPGVGRALAHWRAFIQSSRKAELRVRGCRKRLRTSESGH
jgi:hypothetical protein